VLASARRIGARFDQDPKDVLERHREHGPVGTIPQAAERLKQLEEIGYERVMLQHLAHDDLETVALIGRELAPAVA
jgi:alkanesulfonate monooxygenase SsuD/methylene tetrahydromethanopterin reductase-like flavin-dependent oxidoreductase (luciferase family)